MQQNSSGKNGLWLKGFPLLFLLPVVLLSAIILAAFLQALLRLFTRVRDLKEILVPLYTFRLQQNLVPLSDCLCKPLLWEVTPIVLGISFYMDFITSDSHFT